MLLKPYDHPEADEIANCLEFQVKPDFCLTEIGIILKAVKPIMVHIEGDEFGYGYGTNRIFWCWKHGEV